MRECLLEGLQGTWEPLGQLEAVWENEAGRDLALGLEPLKGFAKPRPGFPLPVSSRVLEKRAHGIQCPSSEFVV